MHLTDLHLVAFCDPAGKPKPGQNLKKVRARSAIVTIGQDPLERIFVLRAFLQKCHPTELREEIFRTGELFPTLRDFGYEGNAAQGQTYDLILDEMQRRHIRLPLRPVLQSTRVDKLWRIRQTVQPVVQAGRLLMLDDQSMGMAELWSEIRDAPTGRTIDGLDALASAIEMLPRRPAPVQEADERAALATYLRRSGAQPHQIQRELRAFDRSHARAPLD